MKLFGEKSPESWKLYLTAGALMIGGPVWHYLYVNRYPFDQPEAVVLPLGAALMGAALAALGHRIGGWLETFGFAALLYVFLDLQFDPDQWTYTLAVVAACIALSTILRQRRAMFTCITLGTLYLASLPRPGATTPDGAPAGAAASPALPVLVHLILDEHWGIGGLRAEGDTATASLVSDFYRQRGFEVYEAAYSRLEWTEVSIRTLVSLGQPPRVTDASITRLAGGVLRAIPYFERLREQGYSIRVYQSSYLDFCHADGAPVVSCDTQPGNSITNISGLDGPWAARALVAGRYFLSVTSHIHERLYHPIAGSADRATASGGLASLDRVRAAIANNPPGGTAFFVHALLPHRPIELDARCIAMSDPARREAYQYPTHRSDSEWRTVISDLGGQTRCALQIVAEILDALDATIGRDGSIVVVHGDHGSRMFQTKPTSRALSKLNRRELSASFSTLLAVRRPGVPSAIHTEPIPVQDALWELALSDFKGSVQHAWRHYVSAQDSTSADTLRSLEVRDMLWATMPTPTSASADSSHFRR